MQSATLTVSGMTCGGCVRSVTNLLQGLDGVAKADVSLEAKRAVVEYDAARVSVDQMKSAIEDAGYEVDG